MHDLYAGLHYVKSNKVIITLLALLATGAVFGSCYNALLPVFAKQVYDGGPVLLGYLLTATGLGALVASLLLAMRDNAAGLGKVIAISGVGISIASIILSVNYSGAVAIGLMFIVGISVTSFAASCNTVLQTVVSEQMRGRISSFYTAAFVGMMPFGGLFGGVMADKFGAQTAVGVSGLISLLVIAGFTNSLLQIDQKLLAKQSQIKPAEVASAPLS